MAPTCTIELCDENKNGNMNREEKEVEVGMYDEVTEGREATM